MIASTHAFHSKAATTNFTVNLEKSNKNVCVPRLRYIHIVADTAADTAAPDSKMIVEQCCTGTSEVEVQ